MLHSWQCGPDAAFDCVVTALPTSAEWIAARAHARI
jgi:hypothetical protein